MDEAERDWKRELQELATRLERERDELKLKLHLAAMEGREDWEEMEQKWGRLRARIRILAEEAGEVSDDVKSAARGLAEELHRGYERIRNLL